MPTSLPSLQTTLQALQRPETFAQVLANVPRSIDQVIERPPVTALLRAGATVASLEACLAIEIAKTANMLTVGGNLRQGQSLEIAKELIAEYPNESLEDFCLCLRNGVKGKYSEPGKTFRFDIMVIFEWFRAYLEEKYVVVEEKLKAEKDDMYRRHYFPTTKPDSGLKIEWPLPMDFRVLFSPVLNKELRERLWIKQWGTRVEGVEARKIKALTTKEILEEGQREPKQGVHRNGYTKEYVKKKWRLARVASDFYKARRTYSGLSIHMIDGFEIFAESESDALEIYMLEEELSKPASDEEQPEPKQLKS